MVSVSKLLEVMARLVHDPQPAFTRAHAYVLLRSLINMPADQRSRVDSLNMMQIALHCPYASSLFLQHTRLCEKLLVNFFVERPMRDAEHDEALRQVIRSVSVNQDLSTSLLLTMTKKLLNLTRELSSRLTLSGVIEQNDALVEELLGRVVSRMPRTGEEIRESEVSFAMTPKAMQKRKGSGFEMPELFFLASVMRLVTTSRAARLKGDVTGENLKALELPAHIVDPVVRCVETLPVFQHDKAPPREDDWTLVAYLVGCCDTRLHGLGKRLWERKTRYHDVMSVHFDDSFFLPAWMAGFVTALRGTFKRSALELWMDILTSPQILQKMNEKILRTLFLDTVLSLLGVSEDKLRERLLAGGCRILDALDVLSTLSTPSPISVHTRLSFTRSFPPLETAEELTKTLLQVKTLLTVNDEINCEFIREVSDFLRHVQRKFKNEEKTWILVLNLLAPHIVKILARPSLDQEHIAAVAPALVTFIAALRVLQEKETLGEEEVGLKALLVTIATKFVHHRTLQFDPFLAALLLQMMELLEFASNAQYTTTVREVVLAALRSLPNKAEITSHTAQHCLDVTFRAVRFHVVDEEVLAAVSMALRHAADAAVLRNINWDQRILTVERSSIVYRELSQFFSTFKEARRLAKRILHIVALIVSEKVAPRPPQSRYEIQRKSQEWKFRRRCAQQVWMVALRASLSPVPRTPIDRYLTPMLRFASKHWIAEELAINEEGGRGGEKKGEGEGAVRHVDEELSRGFFDTMLMMLHPLIISSFTDRSAFYANLRRNKLIISTACEMLQKNGDFLSPNVWFSAQRTLSCLSGALPGESTPLQLSVLRAALTHTLRNAQACGNRGTWHLSEQQKTARQAGGDEDVILTPRLISDMFASADIIDDPELRLYLISLVSEQLEMLETDSATVVADVDETAPFSTDEKARLICLKRTLTTLRRGSVLYY